METGVDVAVPKLLPGESRVVRVLPCPPHMYSYPHACYRLKHAAQRLLESNFQLMWEYPLHLEQVIESVKLLHALAATFKAAPWKRWADDRMGDVLEICCPNCGTVFEWTGHFYAPQCPGCNHWLNKRREPTNA